MYTMAGKHINESKNTQRVFLCVCICDMCTLDSELDVNLESLSKAPSLKYVGRKSCVSQICSVRICIGKNVLRCVCVWAICTWQYDDTYTETYRIIYVIYRAIVNIFIHTLFHIDIQSPNNKCLCFFFVKSE